MRPRWPRRRRRGTAGPTTGTDGESCGRSHRLAGVVGERARVGVGGDEFAERAHDEDDDEAGDDVGDEHSRPGRLDSCARADEESGADRGAEAHHDEVARLHSRFEAGAVGS